MTHHSPTPAILHVDMDSFFASVELLDHPELIGKPVAVGGNSDRGVITSATYEARAFGVRAAMTVGEAKRLCPQLTLLPLHMEKYTAMSRRIMSIFAEFTPLVEPLSVDEAFLDVTGAKRLLGTPREIAFNIRERVAEETGLPSSVGIASTKFVAKLASQKAKPNGVLEIEPKHTLQFLHALPIRAMWGVGRVTGEKLLSRGIDTIGDLAVYPVEKLKRAIGEVSAIKLHELANGRDARSVSTERVEKSVSNEETFEHDISDPTPLMRELLKLSQKVAARMRGKNFMARTIGIKIKFSDFSLITRAHTLPDPTDSSQRIYETAVALLEQAEIAGRRVRLIGVHASQLVDRDLVSEPLWGDDDTAWRAIDKTSDALNARFGKGAVTPARLIDTND
jgi:DNA polymerase-4